MTISAAMLGHETRRECGAMKAQEKSNVPFMLTGVVVGAMRLRLGLLLALRRVIWRDEVDYLLLGRNLLNGQGFTNSDGSPHLVFPPGYPFVVGTLARLVGDLEWASNLAYVLCGGLLLFPVFVIARRLYGAPTAWLGVLLVAVCPALNVSVLYWGSMTEPLYMCLVYGGLATLLVGLEDQRRGLLLTAGLLFGLAYLVCPEAFGHVAMSLLVILAWLMRRSIGMLRQTVLGHRRLRGGLRPRGGPVCAVPAHAHRAMAAGWEGRTDLGVWRGPDAGGLGGY
jgi:hypothetical protein